MYSTFQHDYLVAWGEHAKDAQNTIKQQKVKAAPVHVVKKLMTPNLNTLVPTSGKSGPGGIWTHNPQINSLVQ